MALTDGLVAHYLLQNNAEDNQGAYNGVSHNGVTFDGTGAIFDGDNDYVDTTYKTSLSNNTYSISLWAKRTTIDTSDGIYCEMDSSESSYGTYLNFSSDGSTLTAGHFKSVSGNFDNVGGDISSYISSMTDWIHVVFTRENNNQHKLYVDGVLFNTVPCSDVLSSSSYSGKIGGNPDNSASPTARSFNGSISNFRIYSDVKDQAFIDDLFNEGDTTFSTEIFSDVSEDIIREWSHLIDISRDLTPLYQTFSDVSEDSVLTPTLFQDTSIDHQGYIQIFTDVSANNENIKWSRFYDMSGDETIIHEDTLIKRVTE